MDERHYNNLAVVAGFKRATDEGSLPEIAQYSPYYLPLNVLIASKGSNLYILFTLENNANKIKVVSESADRDEFFAAWEK